MNTWRVDVFTPQDERAAEILDGQTRAWIMNGRLKIKGRPEHMKEQPTPPPKALPQTLALIGLFIILLAMGAAIVASLETVLIRLAG